MEKICLVLPMQPGQHDDARAFILELERRRKEQYARSEERIGITGEAWFLAPLNTSAPVVGVFAREQHERRARAGTG